ncbi:hypothetical protein EGT36_23225 [Agrobacterium sp. FDAARGOS_525]|jgi:3-dehydroquinate synthetase|uniref:hypothetical protein n=1 Tax=Agrobacterium sp. FDAARGOS_525 TaxID=2420311 RepID=UPI000F68243F|nr:hypothetical protein [Agrobacterium sp. FDAARGOS_525]RSC31532.1 hypothetical protein EGT36_23225 [Agrobacterium sp. FDAARGOS_525]
MIFIPFLIVICIFIIYIIGGLIYLGLHGLGHLIENGTRRTWLLIGAAVGIPSFIAAGIAIFNGVQQANRYGGLSNMQRHAAISTRLQLDFWKWNIPSLIECMKYDENLQAVLDRYQCVSSDEIRLVVEKYNEYAAEYDAGKR